MGEPFHQLNYQGINYLYMKLSVVIDQKLAIFYFIARKRASAASSNNSVVLSKRSKTFLRNKFG